MFRRNKKSLVKAPLSPRFFAEPADTKTSQDAALEDAVDAFARTVPYQRFPDALKDSGKDQKKRKNWGCCLKLTLHAKVDDIAVSSKKVLAHAGTQG